jgi:hypothetical protein
MTTQPQSLLQDAYDIHVHCAPDVIPRAQDLDELAEQAHQAGMAGVLLKDHTAPTVGRAHALNCLRPKGPRFLSALVLNPPVGALNPFAVEAALRQGADVICMPTYAAKHQIDVLGPDGFSPAYPRPEGFEGIAVLDEAREIDAEVLEILDLIAQHDAVLATGHVSTEEVFALLKAVQLYGIRRVVVTHASHAVPAMSVAEQRQATAYGAFIEHCLMPIIVSGPGAIAVEEIRDQIRAVGVEHVILSSDLGQVDNGPVVAGFARCLGKLIAAGLTEDEIRVMIVDNPKKLLERE